jgi:hypothetical protein
VPTGIDERFWLPSTPPLGNRKLVYRPGLLATVSCHYVRSSADLDAWVDKSLVYQLDRVLPNDVWLDAHELPRGLLELGKQPEEEYGFSELPAEMLNSKQYKKWEKDLADHLYRHLPAKLYQCVELKKTSQLGQDELDARMSWGQEIRELRDAEKEKLRAKYASKVDSLESKIRTARQRLDREQAQYDKEKWNTALNVGQTVLGWLVGNKVKSRGASAGRSMGRAAQEHNDLRLAHEQLEELMNERNMLEHECDEEINALAERYRPESLTLEAIEVPCRKGDVQVDLLALLWIPWEIDGSGIASPLVALPK